MPEDIHVNVCATPQGLSEPMDNPFISIPHLRMTQQETRGNMEEVSIREVVCSERSWLARKRFGGIHNLRFALFLDKDRKKQYCQSHEGYVGCRMQKEKAWMGDVCTMQYTYVLYTLKEGVFYVGIGTKRRLYTTLHDAGPLESNAKRVEMERRRADGQEILLAVVFEHPEREPTRRCEKALIDAYGPILTNHIGKNTAYPKSSHKSPPPGMRKQRFPLVSCLDCQRLWKQMTDAYHAWNVYPGDQSIQAIYRNCKCSYEKHIATHPVYVPW